MGYRDTYETWVTMIQAKDDIVAEEKKGLLEELNGMDESMIEDAFYRDLAFGTGGLRGTIGAGTNRMNVLTVAKASQGLANYLIKHFEHPSVVIGFDSRIKSDIFAREAGAVFAANGIKVWAWNRLLPVPTVSYATRYIGASAGVMITASHNPSKYNGYKVYGSDGCQITTEAAAEILAEIERIDIFSDVKRMPWSSARIAGKIEVIPEAVLDSFIAEVKGQSVLFGDEVNRDVAIVYSPLNGTGLEPVTRVLEESGFTNITVVEEQRNPDGNFPTCPYPNPEIREAMELGLEYCERTGADLMLATDPDADRCGIAVRNGDHYQLLTGNEVGLLLLDFICAQRTKHNKMPADPLFVKTIVTMDLAEKIADHYGVRTVNVLTGFKFIGEVIGRLADQRDYICGFEESYGYLTGSYVRDKDAVDAAFMICEMFAFYKTRGVSLLDKLNELYATYGYCLNTLHSYEFPGSAGMEKMAKIMKDFHAGLETVGGMKVVKTEDYSIGLNGLPKSDVLKYFYDGEQVHGSVVIRPSGTEPKLKAYISVTAADKAAAEKVESGIKVDLEKKL